MSRVRKKCMINMEPCEDFMNEFHDYMNNSGVDLHPLDKERTLHFSCYSLSVDSLTQVILDDK